MLNLWLIPVRDGIPAAELALDDPSQTLRELASVAVRYVLASRALLRHAAELGRHPSRN